MLSPSDEPPRSRLREAVLLTGQITVHGDVKRPMVAVVADSVATVVADSVAPVVAVIADSVDIAIGYATLGKKRKRLQTLSCDFEPGWGLAQHSHQHT